MLGLWDFTPLIKNVINWMRAEKQNSKYVWIVRFFFMFPAFFLGEINVKFLCESREIDVFERGLKKPQEGKGWNWFPS